MPCGSSYINYSLTSQFLCVKGFGNICFERNLKAVLLVSGRAALFILFATHRFYLLPLRFFLLHFAYPSVASDIALSVQLCRTSYAVRHALHSLHRYPPQVGILAKVAGNFLNHRPVVSVLCGYSKRSGELKPIKGQ